MTEWGYFVSSTMPRGDYSLKIKIYLRYRRNEMDFYNSISN